MKVNLILTNDWELYGEGSGDFYSIQKERLREILEIVERHGAKISLFAEIGQQWAHKREGQKSRWAMSIANEWEKCVKETIARGHDVQLHLHPTWENSFHNGTEWKLDFNTWALIDLGVDKIEDQLRKGKEYLNQLGKSVKLNYECLSFRAGAFCLQPSKVTLPAIARAGLASDSSVVPGYWDYLYFDYRNISTQLGPYLANIEDLTPVSSPEQKNFLELPVHTVQVFDSPILRKILPAWIISKLYFGAKRDVKYLAWSKLRDKNIKLLAALPDPLRLKRFRSKLSPTNWLTYIIRKSTYVLDYDFMQPEVFLEIVVRTIKKAEAAGRKEISLVAIGHANNAHTSENLDRILLGLEKKIGKNLSYQTVQQAVEEAKKNRLEKF